jgi:hypothetical protein
MTTIRLATLRRVGVLEDAMRAEILTEFDAARETLESLAAFAALDRGTAGTWLLQDTSAMRVFGVETLVPRWIRRPLDALRAYADARREATLALEATRERLRAIEARLARGDADDEGPGEEAESLAKEAARLLCFEADLRDRLAEPDAELVERARRGITRVLEVSLPILARATVRYADSALDDGEPGDARRALKHVESYLLLVARANEVTGGVDVPALRSEYLAALQRRAGPTRRSSRRSGGDRMVLS